MPVHELRHSLSDARGAAEALGRRLEGRLDDTDQGLLTHVHATLRRLEEVVDAVLAYQQTFGEMRRQQVDLGMVVDVAMASQVDQVPEDGRIVVGDLPTVRGDHAMLLALFRHLLENAVKFSHPLRPLRARIDARRAAGPWWVVTVADNGVGIPEADLDRVFDMYEQGDPRRTRGQGVGLAAARRIVHAHDGTIWAEHTDPVGTSIMLTLPAADEQHEQHRSTEQPALVRSV